MIRERGIDLWDPADTPVPGRQYLVRIVTDAEASGDGHDEYAIGRLIEGKPGLPGLYVAAPQADGGLQIEELPGDWRGWALQHARYAAVLRDPDPERTPLPTEDYEEVEGPFKRTLYASSGNHNHEDSKGQPGWAKFVGLDDAE